MPTRAQTRMMIHGMEEYALNAPVWADSEAKIGAAAARLRAVAPSQLQLYTVQIDFARSCYASGAFFNAHPECTLTDKGGHQVLNNATQPDVGHCDHNVTVPGKSYPFGACVVYGFNTQCGRDAWVRCVAAACAKPNTGRQCCAPALQSTTARHVALDHRTHSPRLHFIHAACRHLHI